MSKMKLPASLPKLVKPTLDTRFHIDYGWWERQNRDIDVEIRSHLCRVHRDAYGDRSIVDKIDWVNEKTGEVTQVNGLEHVLRVHCSKQPDYLHDRLTIVEAVLRVFLANGNEPLTCEQLGEILARPAEKILRTLSGRRVYKGIRPVH